VYLSASFSSLPAVFFIMRCLIIVMLLTSGVLMVDFLYVLNALVSFMDSLDSTLDKDGKPVCGRLNDDMRPIAENTGEQRTATDTGHIPTNNRADDDEEDDDDNSDQVDGYDELDGTVPAGSTHDIIGSVTQMEDDGSDNKISFTTMTGAIGKTASG
jgi:hypothetical protein